MILADNTCTQRSADLDGYMYLFTANSFVSNAFSLDSKILLKVPTSNFLKQSGMNVQREDIHKYRSIPYIWLRTFLNHSRLDLPKLNRGD